MALGYIEVLRHTRLDDINTQIGTNGKIKIYSDGAARPATGGTIGASVLLGTLTMDAINAFAAATGGKIVANTIVDDALADATGTALWFRVTTSADVFVMDGDIGVSASDLNLNTTAIVINATISITQFDITAGNP